MTDQSPPLAGVQVTLRIFASGLDPEEVTRNLGVLPDHQHYQGDYPRHNPRYSAYKHGMWCLDSKIDPHLSLEQHIQSIVQAVDAKRSYIKMLSETATVDFYCVLRNGYGFQLSPQVLEASAKLGATFGITIEPPLEGDIQET